MTYRDVFSEYESKREQMRRFLLDHYVRDFRLAPGSLLDAGCGMGFWSAMFAEAGFTVSAFDMDLDLVADARELHPMIDFDIADVNGDLSRFGVFDVVFARTLPQFYQRTVEPFVQVVGNLVGNVKRGGLLLLSAYTDGTGKDRPTMAAGIARHHPVSALVEAATDFGKVEAVRTGNYLQIGVRPR